MSLNTAYQKYFQSVRQCDDILLKEENRARLLQQALLLSKLLDNKPQEKPKVVELRNKVKHLEEQVKKYQEKLLDSNIATRENVKHLKTMEALTSEIWDLKKEKDQIKALHQTQKAALESKLEAAKVSLARYQNSRSSKYVAEDDDDSKKSIFDDDIDDTMNLSQELSKTTTKRRKLLNKNIRPLSESP